MLIRFLISIWILLLFAIGGRGGSAADETGEAGCLFADLIPSRAALVVSVPRVQWTRRAWERLLNSGEGDGGASVAMNAALGQVVDCLFSVEVSVCPAASEAGRPGWLLVGRVQDVAGLVSALEALERALTDSAASALNPVSRSMESIGDARLTIVTDSAASAGYLVHGPRGLCVLSTDAAVLRETARRIEKPESRLGWLGAADAARRALEAQPGASAGADARFLWIGEDRVLAGEVALGADALRIRAMTQVSPRSVALDARLYAAVAAPSRLTGLRVAPDGALAIAGGALFVSSELQGYLDRLVERMLAALPAPSPSGINAASVGARGRLEALRQWLKEGAALNGLGPECFVTLEGIEFGRPGQMPRVSLVLGVEARAGASVQGPMARFEEMAVEAASAQMPRAAAEPVLPEGVVVIATPAPGGTGGSAVRFVDQPVTLPAGVRMLRRIETGGVDLPMEPAWALADGYLLAGTSSRIVAEAMGGLESSGAGESLRLGAVRGFASECGLDAVHAYFVASPGRAPEVVAALAAAAAVRWAAPGRGALSSMGAPWGKLLGRIGEIMILRSAVPGGIRTECRVRVNQS